MAQAFDRLHHNTNSIEMEKTGVIAGFLLGLLLSLTLVGAPLMDAGVPNWLTAVVVFALVAACTRAGLALGRSVSHLEE